MTVATTTKTKELLASPNTRIELDDHVTGIIRAALDTLSAQTFAVAGQEGEQIFAVRVPLTTQPLRICGKPSLCWPVGATGMGRSCSKRFLLGSSIAPIVITLAGRTGCG
jgi:hypothetical protein